MRKHDNKRSKRQSQELGELEKLVKEKLEQTRLVMHIRFHYGNLEDNKQPCKYDDEESDSDLPEQTEPEEKLRNPSYIEFRRDEDSKVVYGDCRRLKAGIFEIITKFVPGVLGINYSQPYKGVFRASPVLYQELEIENREFHIDMLSELNTFLEAYLSRNPLRKIR